MTAMGWLGNVVVKTIINGAALYLAAAIVPGIHLGEEGSATKTVGTVLVVALIFGIINAILKPLVQLLSLPVIVLTLGLFLLVINAALLGLTAAISDRLTVDGFGTALIGGLILALVGWAADQLLDRR
jgi:putative membrane protein